MVPFPVLKCIPVGKAGWIAHVATTPPVRFWRMAPAIASFVRTWDWEDGLRDAVGSTMVRVTSTYAFPCVLFPWTR